MLLARSASLPGTHHGRRGQHYLTQVPAAAPATLRQGRLPSFTIQVALPDG